MRWPKTALAVVIALLPVFTSGCGPLKARVTVAVSSQMPEEDVLTVYINSEEQDVRLDKDHPTHQYRPLVQVREDNSISGIDQGRVYVNVYSQQLGQLSRTKSQTAYTDRVIEFSFRQSDFIVFSIQNPGDDPLEISFNERVVSSRLQPGRKDSYYVFDGLEESEEAVRVVVRNTRTGEVLYDKLIGGDAPADKLQFIAR